AGRALSRSRCGGVYSYRVKHHALSTVTLDPVVRTRPLCWTAFITLNRIRVPRRGEVDFRAERGSRVRGFPTYRETRTPSPHPSPLRGEGADRVRGVDSGQQERSCAHRASASPTSCASFSASSRKAADAPS